jgi:hypothetical protein
VIWSKDWSTFLGEPNEDSATNGSTAGTVRLAAIHFENSIIVLADDWPVAESVSDLPIIDLRGWQGEADPRIDALITAVRQYSANSQSAIPGQGTPADTISNPTFHDPSNAVIHTPTVSGAPSSDHADIPVQSRSEKKLLFLCYRREDTQDAAGRLHDRLVATFGSETVFMDIDSVPLGIDFVDHVTEQISQCSAVIVMIGRQWLTVQDKQGRKRLEADNDLVRVEVAAALQRRIPVIPVLVQDAKMPHADDLPDDIRLLARRNGIQLDATRWRTDVERLIKELNRVMKPDSKNR